MASIDQTPPPREPRSTVIIRAVVTHGDERSERRVRNLSTTGACVDAQGDLPEGATVTIEIGNARAVFADVVWVKSTMAGLRFRSALDLAAARKPRAPSAPGALLKAGWAAELDHAYRRGG